MSVRIDGLEAARAELERKLRAVSNGAESGLEAVGQQVTTETRRRAPLLTGRLRRSYAWESGPGYVEVGTNVEYAPAQEYGTRHQPGTPHLRPALEAVGPRIPALIAQGAARGLGGGSSLSGGGFGAVAAALRGL